ncbi:MAG: antitoxin Xre-like helix-turn-helix domain-containing protein [Planctomycetota bacterium]
MGTPRIVASANPRTVLTKAVQRAAAFLGLNQRDLAAVLGSSEASISRLGKQRSLDPVSKEGELALLFLRAYRSLDAMVGGNTDQAREWFGAENQHLGGAPRLLVRSVAGLVATVQYLDAMRGRN